MFKDARQRIRRYDVKPVRHNRRAQDPPRSVEKLFPSHPLFWRNEYHSGAGHRVRFDPTQQAIRVPRKAGFFRGERSFVESTNPVMDRNRAIVLLLLSQPECVSSAARLECEVVHCSATVLFVWSFRIEASGFEVLARLESEKASREFGRGFNVRIPGRSEPLHLRNLA